MKRIRANFQSKLLAAKAEELPPEEVIPVPVEEEEEEDFDPGEQEFDSANTSLRPTQRRTEGGIPTLYFQIDEWPIGGTALDYGCGRPENAEVVRKFMADREVKCYSWDRNFKQFNEEAKAVLKQPVDIVTCSLVLNVIKGDAAILQALRNMNKALKPGGIAYFAVWCGPKKERDQGGKPTGGGKFQNFSSLEYYTDLTEKVFGAGSAHPMHVSGKSENEFFYATK